MQDNGSSEFDWYEIGAGVVPVLFVLVVVWMLLYTEGDTAPAEVVTEEQGRPNG